MNRREPRQLLKRGRWLAAMLIASGGVNFAAAQLPRGGDNLPALPQPVAPAPIVAVAEPLSPLSAPPAPVQSFIPPLAPATLPPSTPPKSVSTKAEEPPLASRHSAVAAVPLPTPVPPARSPIFPASPAVLPPASSAPGQDSISPSAVVDATDWEAGGGETKPAPRGIDEPKDKPFQLAALRVLPAEAVAPRSLPPVIKPVTPVQSVAKAEECPQTQTPSVIQPAANVSEAYPSAAAPNRLPSGAAKPEAVLTPRKDPFIEYFALGRGDFDLNTATLNANGSRHLEGIARRLTLSSAPVTLEATGNANLDQSRRLAVIESLAKQGVHPASAQARVVVGQMGPGSIRSSEGALPASARFGGERVTPASSADPSRSLYENLGTFGGTGFGGR